MKNYIFLLVFVLCSAIAQEGYGRDVKRVVTRSFRAVGGMQLLVDNRYGDIIVKTWDSNEINFSVEIKGKARKEDMAQRMVERVKINFAGTSALVTARTVIVENKENCSDCGVEINYTIQVPMNIRLNLTNKYGNIFLDRTGGTFRGDINYGNIEIGELGGSSNRIVCKYGNVFVNKAMNLNLDVSHSDVSVDEVKLLSLCSSYSGIKVGTAERVIMDSKYDNFQMKKIGECLANSAKYTHVRIETLDGNLLVDGMAYGELKVSRLSLNPGRIMVNSVYSNITIGVVPQNAVRVDILNRFGSMSISKNLNTSRLNIPHGLSKGNDVEHVFGILGEDVDNQGKIVVRNSHGKIHLGE